MLPENKKINRDPSSQIKLWIYGEPTIGKTIFANKFPDVLFLNTDGNIKYIDSPVAPIIPSKTEEPWEKFINTINELVTTEHSYKTVVIDLLEDVYQYCRAYYAKKLNIDHEADLGYGKGYDIIRNAFLIVLRTLVSSNLNIIFISHEKVTSIKDRIGRELTRFQPAIPESIAGKVSGMVDITGRVTIKTEEDPDGKLIDRRILYLDATKEQVGGNRIPSIQEEYIPLEYEELIKVYKRKE